MTFEGTDNRCSGIQTYLLVELPQDVSKGLPLADLEDINFFSFEDLAGTFCSLSFFGAGVRPEDSDFFTGRLS